MEKIKFLSFYYKDKEYDNTTNEFTEAELQYIKMRLESSLQESMDMINAHTSEVRVTINSHTKNDYSFIFVGLSPLYEGIIRGRLT